MRRPISVLLFLCAGLACTRDNPAFDDCSLPDQCIGGESETSTGGDGDGDATTASTTTTTTTTATGDGDGDEPTTGPSESSTGDGDPTSTGPGESSTGDGDGDGYELPPCPEVELFELHVAADTFLDDSYYPQESCLVSYDFDTQQPELTFAGPCALLEFGGAPTHPVCNEGNCSSVWLAEFALGEVVELGGEVQAAWLQIQAEVANEESNEVRIYDFFAVDSSVYDDCDTWKAGGGNGVPPGPCVTTGAYAANPFLWSDFAPYTVDLLPLIGSTNVPPVIPHDTHGAKIDLDPDTVQEWIDSPGGLPHAAMTTDAWLAKEFYLYAQGSGIGPVLGVELCEP